MATDVLNLDRQLCFALYAAIRSVTRIYRERLDPLGLTYPQYLVLLTLFEEDGLTISQIGSRLKLDSGTLTPLIKRLASNGIVHRARNPSDEREVRIWLLPRAHELKPGLLEARRYVAKRLGLTEREISGLRAELMDLVDHLEGNEPALATLAG